MAGVCLLKDWLKLGDCEVASGEGTQCTLPCFVQERSLEVLLGKIYTCAASSSVDTPLHTWTCSVSDSSGVEAAYTTQIYKQASGVKFKYLLRFKASYGKILLIQELQATVKRVRRGTEDELLVLEPQPNEPLSFTFTTSVHCRRELDLRVHFVLLLKAESPAPSDYRPPSTSVLFAKRQETGDLTLAATEGADGVRSCFPVHSAVLKLCCAYFQTALGDSWKKGSEVELPVLAGPEAAELLVTFIYLGKARFSELLSQSDSFDTAEQLYLLGDALDIQILRHVAGSRIEQTDFVRPALSSKLRDHERFAAEHLERVAEVGRDMAMKHSARAQIDLIAAILQACPEESSRKRSADEMLETDGPGGEETSHAEKEARVDESPSLS